MAVISGSKPKAQPIASSITGGTVYKQPTGRNVVKPIAPQTAYNKAYGGGGSVLGANTTATQPVYQAPQQSSAPQTGYEQFPYEQVPEQPNIDFDAMIAPAIQGLEAAIAPLQEGFANDQASFESSRQRGIEQTNQSIAGQTGQLEGAKVTQGRMAESASDEARRQFSEIQQGLQANFGGTTGTGAFATELAGRQTMQNLGNIKQGLSTAISEIDNKLVQVKEIGRLAVQDIEDKTRENVNQARQQLNQAIAEIRAKQGELQARKSEMAYQAVQQYQGLVADINARNASMKQDLFMRQKAAEDNLAAQRTRAADVAKSFSLYNLQQGNQITPLKGYKDGTFENFEGQQIAPTSGRLYPASVGTGIGALGSEDEDPNNPGGLLKL